MVRCCKSLANGQILLLTVTLAGCALPLGPPTLIRDDLDAESLRAALRHSVAYLRKLPAERVVG